jgi:NurA-like 5'-3' nuclease
MGLDFEPLRIEDSSLGKAEAAIIRDPECETIEQQLIAENERLQLLIVELLMKNEHLRIRLQDKKSI